VLLTVGLHLARLADMPGVGSDPDLFLHKLGSLARLAFSAAAQKREFLRRHLPETSPLRRGFLLDRARLVVVPVGLEGVVRTLTGGDLCTSRPALDLAKKVVQRLRDVLRRDGPTYRLDASLDSAEGFSLHREEGTSCPAQKQDVAGLTPWDPGAPPQTQVRAAGALHAGEAGTAAVLLPEERSPTGEEVADLLRYAGQQTDVIRLRFVRTGSPAHQLTATWDAETG
jgi:hypothetical protein